MIFNLFLLSIIAFALDILGYILLKANPLQYEAIFNFGDSISDTGNYDKDDGYFPGDEIYGTTYFKHASGRKSDGRLIIDFIAGAYGLPFLPAYLTLTKGQNIKKGVNFAYAGATAIHDAKYFAQNTELFLFSTNNSLSVQLGWFKMLKSSLCKSKEECDKYFKRTLFLVGEIGWNDILYHIQVGKNITQLREIVSPIVESIANTTTALIEEGAVQLGVPGNFPIGCNAVIIDMVNSTKKEDYDQFGCLIAYNTLIEYFDEQLKLAIMSLRKKYPEATIMYFDYYNNAKRLFQEPEKYGLISDKNEILKPCFDRFGSNGPTVCSDISKRINWDGPHFTEAAHKIIAKGLVEGSFVEPPLKSTRFKIV